MDAAITLFLAGDVMLGRGVDQILPHPGDPTLHEGYATSALDYVRLAERVHGPIPRPVDFDYVWGEALAEWARVRPDLRIINLETAITDRGPWARDKGIHYRLHPDNLPVLAAAGIHACALANNHVLDWGTVGLADTLAALDRVGIAHAGAGRDRDEARAPAVLPVPGGRVLLFAFGTADSGIPEHWAAGPGTPGVWLLPDLSTGTLADIAREIARVRGPGDRVVVSVHWGPNWGYAIPESRRAFAHGLIERCGVHLVHGHSSHHPLGLEVYRQRLIIHGCGDFLNDYEGIHGYEAYRGDLTLMYFPRIAADGRLLGLEMVPLQIRRLRLAAASGADRLWLAERLDRESRPLGARIEADREGRLHLRG